MSIKALGTLYLLGAGFVPLVLMMMLTALPWHSDLGRQPWDYVVALVALGGLYGAIGWGLRRLNGLARVAATLFAILGLLGFPIGTLVSIYLLYLLLSPKGSTVFSAEYAGVVARTPHIKYRTSPLLKGLLVVLAVCFVGGMVLVMFGV